MTASAMPQILVTDSAGLITRIVFTRYPEIQISTAEVTAGGALFSVPEHDGITIDASTFKIVDGAFAPIDPEYSGDLPAWDLDAVIID